jgi:hypothetical protein
MQFVDQPCRQVLPDRRHAAPDPHICACRDLPRPREPVMRRQVRSIWSIRNWKASKYVRPSLERRRPRERVSRPAR